MDLVSIVIIAVGLSMDSFAVSIVNGLMMPKLKFFSAVYIALFLAFFQAAMPVLGYWGGSLIENEIKSIDHWLAFILLSFIGGKMIYEGLESSDNFKVKDDFKLSLTKLISQSIATSIDALAVGISFAFLDIEIFSTAFIIGVVTFLFSMVGLRMGKSIGAKTRGRMEIVGGLFLIGIGLKILIEHTLLT